jgi:hypothetical protein
MSIPRPACCPFQARKLAVRDGARGGPAGRW